jgi:DNA repair protein RecN (Recombination protein N)
MLKTLRIKNYALIDELEAEFSNGLAIITGETGTGKSIIIDALSLVLGARASSDEVRTGAEKAVVEAVLNVAGNKKLAALFERNEAAFADELILRREISAKGQSRCFINDSPATSAFQKQVGELLVDLHGQHDHQSLLRVNTHIEMLDEFGGLDGVVAAFQVAHRKLQDLSGQLRDLRRQEEQLREKREFLQFQIQEIDAVAPHAGEEEQLETELKILENSEKLFGATAKLYEMLYEGDRSVHDLLAAVRNQLNDLGGIDKQFEEAGRECNSAVAVVSELAKFIQTYNARVEFNPEKLEHVRERLGRLAYLKKKYGGSLESVLSHREKIGREAALAENVDAVIAKLSNEVETARAECAVIAQRLSARREETARKIDKAIVVELAKLGIEHGKFTTLIAQWEFSSDTPTDGAVQYATLAKKKVALNDRGWDVVEFLISTNVGEDVKPLVKVASGGEVSRIMLALKSILAKSDRLPVLIFDEIDVGVSGRIAQSVGLSLKNLSSFHQVIAITHLPQIAGLADAHYVVDKSENGKRAVTSIHKLSLDERVHEVAKLMSGAKVTEAGLKGARELMSIAKDHS